MVGGAKFHCHHHCALKNFKSFPNLKGLVHFGCLGASDQVRDKKVNGSNLNLFFYYSIHYFFVNQEVKFILPIGK